jgi:hypothetical protein
MNRPKKKDTCQHLKSKGRKLAFRKTREEQESVEETSKLTVAWKENRSQLLL